MSRRSRSVAWSISSTFDVASIPAEDSASPGRRKPRSLAVTSRAHFANTPGPWRDRSSTRARAGSCGCRSARGSPSASSHASAPILRQFLARRYPPTPRRPTMQRALACAQRLSRSRGNLAGGRSCSAGCRSPVLASRPGKPPTAGALQRGARPSSTPTAAHATIPAMPKASMAVPRGVFDRVEGSATREFPIHPRGAASNHLGVHVEALHVHARDYRPYGSRSVSSMRMLIS